jgi:hypothetical protein
MNADFQLLARDCLITRKVCRLSSLGRCFICANLRNLRITAFSRFNDQAHGVAVPINVNEGEFR